MSFLARCASAIATIALVLGGTCASAQHGRVTARIVVERKDQQPAPGRDLATVVWLTPLDVPGGAPAPTPRAGVQLLQKNKRFDPHILIVPVGTAVEFPNRDPFFHNVFSLFNGKRFDLGLYEAGSSRTVHFDRPGISYIFCNIHSEMSAVVIALDTPYYALPDTAGSVVIDDVRPGRYRLNVWHEGSSPDILKSLSRPLTVSSAETALGSLTVLQDKVALAHKNKYGRDYEEPAKPAYDRH